MKWKARRLKVKTPNMGLTMQRGFIPVLESVWRSKQGSGADFPTHYAIKSQKLQILCDSKSRHFMIETGNREGI